MEEARKAMIAKRFGGNANGANTGGAVRRKKKAAAKTGGDDKKLGSVLKKMSMNAINGVEEVNIFKEDGAVIHIRQPKIQCSVPSNTFVVSGHTEVKRLEELLPGILTQLGPESMDYLRAYAEAMGGKAAAAAGKGPAVETIQEGEEEDEEVPDLVENFEEAANK
jgi:nascent polypeptide-associated complex subunit beta